MDVAGGEPFAAHVPRGKLIGATSSGLTCGDSLKWRLRFQRRRRRGVRPTSGDLFGGRVEVADAAEPMPADEVAVAGLGASDLGQSATSTWSSGLSTPGPIQSWWRRQTFWSWRAQTVTVAVMPLAAMQRRQAGRVVSGL